MTDANEPAGPPSGPGVSTGGVPSAPGGPPHAGGPPASGGGPPTTGGPPPTGGAGTGRPSTPALLAMAAAVGVAIVAVLVLATGSDDNTAQDEPVVGPSEVLLEPNDVLGPEPFDDATAVTGVGPELMPTTSALETTTVEPTTVPATTTVGAPATTTAQPGIATLVGSNPGLYGGTRDNQSCDREQMKAFLATNPTKAQAWVSALNTDPTVQWSGPTPLTTNDIGPYIDELTPVLLTGDTRVTNHGFGNGSFTSRQVVLQAGTAVLVDRWGVPRARCLCGNPLTKPIPVQGATGTTYVGPRWPTFNPTTIVVVVAASQPMDTLVIIDVQTGTIIVRAVGTDGSVDTTPEATTTTAPPPATTAPATTLPPTTTTTTTTTAPPVTTPATTVAPSPTTPATTPGPTPDTVLPGTTFCERLDYYSNASIDYESDEQVLAYIRSAINELTDLAPLDIAADLQTILAAFEVAWAQDLDDLSPEAMAAEARIEAYARDVCGLNLDE